MRGKSAEVLQHIAGLTVVPPAERLDGHPEFFEGCFSLLDLDLSATVSQHEWHMAVENYFHRLGLSPSRKSFGWTGFYSHPRPWLRRGRPLQTPPWGPPGAPG